jgi:hypothetical protein
MEKIEITIPKNFMNVAVTINNRLIANNNDSECYDDLSFPLPEGNWKIYSDKGKHVILIKV